MTSESIQNVARCVLEYTEVKRSHNGRGRPKTYAADIDAIAGAARQLAELVLAEEGRVTPEVTADYDDMGH